MLRLSSLVKGTQQQQRARQRATTATTTTTTTTTPVLAPTTTPTTTMSTTRRGQLTNRTINQPIHQNQRTQQSTIHPKTNNRRTCTAQAARLLGLQLKSSQSPPQTPSGSASWFSPCLEGRKPSTRPALRRCLPAVQSIAKPKSIEQARGGAELKREVVSRAALWRFYVVLCCAHTIPYFLLSRRTYDALTIIPLLDLVQARKHANGTAPYHNVPYRTASYRSVVPHHTVPYRLIPFGTVAYRAASYRIASYHSAPHHPVPYHIIPYRPHQTVPHHTVPCRTVPYRTASYCAIPYRITLVLHRTAPYHTAPYIAAPHRVIVHCCVKPQRIIPHRTAAVNGAGSGAQLYAVDCMRVYALSCV